MIITRPWTANTISMYDTRNKHTWQGTNMRHWQHSLIQRLQHPLWPLHAMSLKVGVFVRPGDLISVCASVATRCRMQRLKRVTLSCNVRFLGVRLFGWVVKKIFNHLGGWWFAISIIVSAWDMMWYLRIGPAKVANWAPLAQNGATLDIYHTIMSKYNFLIEHVI